MNDSTRHHFVPIFFQKNFTNGSEKIWMHKQGIAPIHIACEEIAFENDLNTRIKNGKKNTSNETLLSEIESIAGPIIRKIIETDSLTSLTGAERYDFAAFVILLSERSPRSFQISDALARKGIEYGFREGAKDLSDNEISKIVESIAAQNPEITNVSFEEVKDFLVKGPHSESIKFSHSHGLLNMWQSAKEGTPFILKRDWSLLRPINNRDEFILSDDPVLTVFADEHGVELAKGGWARKSMELLLPLSPTLLFYASYGISQIDIKLDTDEMAIINGLSKKGSMRYFLSGSQNPNPIF